MDYSVSSVTGPIRVFLLDDHEVVRRGLNDLLEQRAGNERRRRGKHGC